MLRSEYKSKYNEYLRIVEDALFGIESASQGEGGIYPALHKAMFYSLRAGGKRLRPCLALAVCDMLSGSVQPVLPVACGLEMIHTYSLIHDDLPCMDDDDMRRGRPSNHKVFGEAMAVLAGDGLLSFAFETMLAGAAGLEGERLSGYLKAVNEVAVRAGAMGMVTGQAADIENESTFDRSEQKLLFIHRHKTADMLCAAVLAGAYAACADEAVVSKLKAYAENIGLLFQITDDILDLSGDPSVVGKTLGKDEKESKLTFISVYGPEGARKAAEAAAEKARLAAAGLSDNEFLLAAVDDILYRSY